MACEPGTLLDDARCLSCLERHFLRSIIAYLVCSWDDEPPVTPPDPPVATAATSVTSSSFTAHWNASAGATGYRLDVSTSPIFASFVTGFNNLDVSNVLSYAVSGLADDTTYYYRVRAYNTGGTSGNSNTINLTTTEGLLDGIVGYYKLEEDGTAARVNAVPAGVSLIPSGSIQNATGKINFGVHPSVPDTGQSYMAEGSNGNYAFFNHSFSFSCWLNSAVLPGFDLAHVLGIMGTPPENNPDSAWWFAISNANPDTVEFTILDLIGNKVSLFNSAFIGDGVWNHFVGTYNATTRTMHLYQNSVDVGTTATVPITGMIPGPHLDFTLCANDNTDFPMEDGIIDEVGLWNRVLTPAEVIELYNGGAGNQYPF